MLRMRLICHAKALDREKKRACKKAQRLHLRGKKWLFHMSPWRHLLLRCDDTNEFRMEKLTAVWLGALLKWIVGMYTANFLIQFKLKLNFSTFQHASLKFEQERPNQEKSPQAQKALDQTPDIFHPGMATPCRLAVVSCSGRFHQSFHGAALAGGIGAASFGIILHRTGTITHTHT